MLRYDEHTPRWKLFDLQYLGHFLLSISRQAPDVQPNVLKILRITKTAQVGVISIPLKEYLFIYTQDSGWPFDNL